MKSAICGVILTMTCVTGYVAPALAAPPADKSLAEQAYNVFEHRCSECHAQLNKSGGLNLFDRAQLIGGPKKYVVPKDLKASRLWTRVKEKEMPPEPRKPLSDEDLEIVRRWIEAGAPPYEITKVARPFLTEKDVLQCIHDDLKSEDEFARPYFRYFSLVHLYNNETVSERDLATFRAALSKAVNSLSWARDIHVPRVVPGSRGALLRVDVRFLRWERPKGSDIWGLVLSEYPYGLTSEGQPAVIQDLAKVITGWSQKALPAVRADWFITKMTAPPLYHQILELPPTARELEKKLDVDTEENFLRGELARAGIITSEVTNNNNRAIDRHWSQYGAYYISYDFKTSKGKQELARNPLGPAFKGNPYLDHAFQQDGGEIIFSLPNGLQAYFVVNGSGKRLDEAPSEVVKDPSQPLGHTRIVNGISCMICHSEGIKPLEDKLRNAAPEGVDQKKVARLFLRKDGFDRLINLDRDRFLRSLDQATRPFLEKQLPGKAAKDDPTRGEPIGRVVRQYSRDLGLAEFTAELGFPPSEQPALKKRLTEPAFRNLGLATLTDGGGLKREIWEHLSPESRFQEVAYLLGKGGPAHFGNFDK